MQPRGWIGAWARSAANGITGHLDEYSATFHEAWKGYPFAARGAAPDGTGWPLEQCSYWLDGAVRLGFMLQDQALLQKVSSRLDGVVNGVLNGGKSFIYWRPESVLTVPFNNWAHSHMGRALVAYYQASGDQKILAALVKVYRNYPLGDLTSDFHQVGGAVNLDAMSDTYRMSGDPAILKNMLAFAKRQSYRHTANAWVNKQCEAGHNVIFYENIRVPALLFPWTGNRQDLLATTSGLEWNDEYNLLPVGISSGEEYQAGIGCTRNIETCNVAASMWTNLCLARITGLSTYFDRVEQIFFNAGPAPVGRDFKIMSYYQRPNRYSTNLSGVEPANPGEGSYQFTNIGDPVLCCVGNLNRVIPNYVMHMWMATLDGGLAATLYGPSHLTTKVNGNIPVTIDSKTNYPFEETVEFLINPDHETRFSLHFRIPSWTKHPEVSVNGQDISFGEPNRGFQTLSRNWKRGDKVLLRMSMSVRVLKSHETPYPQVPYFRDSREISQLKDIHSPYASVFYGPLLFAWAIPDVSPNQEVRGMKSNYAIDVDSETPSHGEAEVIRNKKYNYQGWNWSLSSPIQIGINAREIAWVPTELQPLPERPLSGPRNRIVLMPYGCTKFGVSMFPRSI